MRLVILLTILSLGLTSCKGEPNAWLCSFILKPNVEESYAFCVHQQSKEEKIVNVKEMHKWIVTDLDSYEHARDWYKNQCTN